MKNKQMTLTGSAFEKYAKTTRRAEFLAEMERVVPWGTTHDQSSALAGSSTR